MLHRLSSNYAAFFFRITSCVIDLLSCFLENFLTSYYRNKGEAYDNVDFPPERKYGQGPNIADLTTSFMILLAIYFPSVTGK